MKDMFEQLFPGLMLMWVCFIANGVFSDIFTEYKDNTIARLITSGVTLWQVLLSKILRGIAICWICELLLILFTGIVFQVNWWNRPFMLFVILTSFNLFLMGLLALVSGYAATSELANSILIFIFLISSVIGGIFIPFNQLPAVLQNIGQWTMLRMGSYGIESLFQSRPHWECLRPGVYLSTAGAVLIWLGVRMLHRRIVTGGIKTGRVK